MNTFTHDSIVNSQEAEALKEMIFKRARERAEALGSEVHNSYTSNIQNDVMDMARNSFVATKNPFSLGDSDSFEKSFQEEESEVVATEEKTFEAQDGLGFSLDSVTAIKNQIVVKNKLSSENIATETVQKNMSEAREDFKSRSSFMGALDFLNSQASIVLVRSKGKAFDAIA